MTVPVTLLMSTYQWPEALGLCLQSVAAQTVMPAEVIVADDGSGEPTRQVVERFRRELPVPVVHLWQPNEGFRPNIMRNRAIAAARHPYIVQIDGDVILDRLFVADHLAFARKGRFVAGRRVMLPRDVTDQLCASGRVERLRTPLRSRLLASAYQLVCWSGTNVEGVRGCNLAYWREDAIRVNGWDETVTSKGPSDKEFCARMVNTGVRAFNLRYHAHQFHLAHGEAGRRINTPVVRALLERTIATGKQTCEVGIAQHGAAGEHDGADLRAT